MATGRMQKYADGTDTGWIAFPLGSNTYTGTIYYRKLGSVVYITAAEIRGITANFNIGSLPAGMRPSTQKWLPAFAGYNVYKLCAAIRIYTGGTVQFTLLSDHGTTSNTQFYIECSFAV